MPITGSQRHLFDIPDDVTYLNAAYAGFTSDRHAGSERPPQRCRGQAPRGAGVRQRPGGFDSRRSHLYNGICDVDRLFSVLDAVL